jgi:hypothetical protein
MISEEPGENQDMILKITPQKPIARQVPVETFG